ncbi:MAG TPA: hypothetical protein DCQ34_05100 [Chitinophagaceae bacterium]|nr:hypothetical protein [Chitinophagaceae bacterium]
MNNSKEAGPSNSVGLRDSGHRFLKPASSKAFAENPRGPDFPRRVAGYAKMPADCGFQPIGRV